MIKRGQKTELDRELSLEKDRFTNPRFTNPSVQMDLLVDRKNYNRPLIEEGYDPVRNKLRYRIEQEKKEQKRKLQDFSLPDLTPDQINYRKLNQKETDHLLSEEADELRRGEQYYSNRKDPPTTQQYFDLNKKLPEEAKKEILEVYNQLKEISNKFQLAYKEANSLAATNLDFDYSGTYIDIFKRIPDFIERACKQGIGRIFGITNEKSGRTLDRNSLQTTIKLVDFLENGGVNLFNLTPLNVEKKKRKMNEAILQMKAIAAEYEKRKKVLIKLPKLVNQSCQQYLRREDNREFLKWMELYFANDKVNFFSGIIEQIIYSEYGGSTYFNMKSLQSMKTYSEIHFKAQMTATFEARQTLERQARNAIVIEIKNEVDKILASEIPKLINIIDNLNINDTSSFEKFIYNNYNLDLRGTFQIIGIIMNNYYSHSDTLKIAFKEKFIENLRHLLTPSNEKSTGILGGIINRFISDFSKSGGRIERNKLDKLTAKDYEKIVNEFVRLVVIKALPNFELRDFGGGRGPDNSINFPQFSGLGAILKQTGKLNINTTVDLISKKAPFIPKEFIIGLVKFAFKGTVREFGKDDDEKLTSTEMFREFCVLELERDRIALKILLENLKKYNKYNVDSFINYFRLIYKKIVASVGYFENNYVQSKNLTEDDKILIIGKFFKNPDNYLKEYDVLENFIKHLHDNAGELSKKDLLNIVNNKNFNNYGKIGIAKKLLNCISVIKNAGGINKIKEKYDNVIKAMKEGGFVSQNFEKNINFVIRLFNSNQEINPAHPNFRKIFDIISTIETDIQTIEMSAETQELLKNYQKKDSRLFDLNYNIDNNLRFRVLADKDPRILRIGIETNCCQRIGGAGEEAAKQSFVNPLAGVLILEWLDENDEWKLLTQSYFHYVPRSNGYILDNVEYNKSNCTKSGVDLEKSYALLAAKIKEKLDVDYFLAGKSYSKIDDDKFKTYRLKGGDPRYFAKINGRRGNYSDFSPSNSIDLLSPKFKTNQNAKKANNLNILSDIFLKFSAV